MTDGIKPQHDLDERKRLGREIGLENAQRRRGPAELGGATPEQWVAFCNAPRFNDALQACSEGGYKLGYEAGSKAVLALVVPMLEHIRSAIERVC